MEIEIEGWEDGVPFRHVLTSLDRWRVQSAQHVTVRIAGSSIWILQKPQAISSSRVGVGACLWDSSFVLTAFLAGLDPLIWASARVIELGAGLGLPGLFVARHGARVTLTDTAPVLELTQQNVALNASGMLHAGRGTDRVEVTELDWSTMSHESISALASPAPDYILAADCLYIDMGGSTPSAAAFFRACAALCDPGTCCFVALEQRSSEVMQAFFDSAAREGFHLERPALGEEVRALCGEHVLLFSMSLNAK